jgi:hypothetical protein
MDITPGIYQHYKGKTYKVIGIVRHSETLEELVLYRALYESIDFGKNAFWVRPKAMFLEKIHFNGENISRFTYLGPTDSVI